MSTILVKVDLPAAKQAELTVDDTSTFGSVRQQAAKALGVDLARYTAVGAAYGSDVVDWSDAAAAADEKVGDRLPPRSVLFLFAPADLKPTRKKKDEKTDGKKEKEAEDDDDKYKGFTVQNALEKLTKAQGKAQALAWEYVDINIAEIAKLPAFLKAVSKPTLIELCKRNTLNIEETQLLDLVLAWGNAEAKKSGSDLKSALTGLYQFVRYPILPLADIASKVNPSGLLDQKQLLELFTFSATDRKGKPGPSLSAFSSLPREPRDAPWQWHWQLDNHGTDVVLTNKGLTAEITTSTYNTVIGTKPIKSGKRYWEIRIERLSWMMLGCSTGTINTKANNESSSEVWYMYNHGGLFHAGGGSNSGFSVQSYGVGDTIGVLVEYKDGLGSISYYRNGNPLGTAWSGIGHELWPNIEFNGSALFHLNTKAKIPST